VEVLRVPGRREARLVNSYPVSIAVADRWLDLERQGRILEREALARKTAAGYDTAVRGFILFCTSLAITFPPRGALAVEVVKRFYIYLIKSARLFASVKKARSAIADFYNARGWPPPTEHFGAIFRFRRIKLWCEEFCPERQAKAIPRSIAKALIAMTKGPHWGVNECSLLCNILLYLTGVRSGSLLALYASDITLSGPFVRVVWRVVKYRKGKPVVVKYPLRWEAYPDFWPRFIRFANSRPSTRPIFSYLKDSSGVSECVSMTVAFLGMDVQSDEEFSRVSAQSWRRSRAQESEATKGRLFTSEVLMHKDTSTARVYVALRGKSLPLWLNMGKIENGCYFALPSVIAQQGFFPHTFLDHAS